MRFESAASLLEAFSLTVLSLHGLPFGLAPPLLLPHGATIGFLRLAPIFFKQARKFLILSPDAPLRSFSDPPQINWHVPRPSPCDVPYTLSSSPARVGARISRLLRANFAPPRLWGSPRRRASV